MKTERRFATLEFQETDQGPGVLRGLAVPYERETVLYPGYREKFAAGSLADQVNAPICANIQHQRSRPLARNLQKLALTENAEGLTAEITLPDTGDGRDCAVLVRQGVLRGLSVEFIPLEESGGDGLRIVTRARLMGLAVVDDPAYEDAKVELQRLAQRWGALEPVEGWPEGWVW